MRMVSYPGQDMLQVFGQSVISAVEECPGLCRPGKGEASPGGEADLEFRRPPGKPEKVLEIIQENI